MKKRALELLDLSLYEKADQTLLFLDPLKSLREIAPEHQKILRMLVKSPWSQGFKIPPELEWTRDLVGQVWRYQRENFMDHAFCYLTVRCGIVDTKTDAVWHVDGFSKRTPHVPEQNYLLTTSHPTEILTQNFKIPKDFDPFKHNIHRFFQQRADSKNIVVAPENKIWIFDPYLVHRRPANSTGAYRKMLRISFVPVEIEDDTCQQNPLLPIKKYNRPDIRDSLVDYKGD